MLTLYGIGTCDTVRKARKWLAEQGIEYHFHDFRREGIEQARIERWLAQTGADVLLNRRGSTWRRLDGQQRQMADDGRLAELLVAEPTLIKRPVLEHRGGVEVGFDPARYARLVG